MSDSSDDEYAPIEVTTWGSQTPIQSDNTEEESKGWDSLLDPDIKVGPNNIGSGNLHRRGTNFKPIGEDLILAQRLNKPVGKKIMQLAIRETEMNLGLPVGKDKSQRNNNKKKPTQVDNGTRKFSHRTTTSTSSTTNRKSYSEVPSTTKVPVLSISTEGGGSKWLQSSLVDTPFWNEKKEEATNKPFDIPPQSPPTAKPSQQSTPSPLYTNSRTVNSIRNGKKLIPLKPKPESVWMKGVSSWTDKDAKDGWGAAAKVIEPFVNPGWDRDTTSDKAQTPPANTVKETQFNNTGRWGDKPSSNVTNNSLAGWGVDDSGWTAGSDKDTRSAIGWGVESTNTNTKTNGSGWGVKSPVSANRGWGTPASNDAISLSKPSWVNSASMQDNNSPKSPPVQSGSRFSNPSKQRYSKNAPMNVPKPLNYRSQHSQPAPLATAPPPPPENNLLVTINVELSEALKVKVDIHELDEPSQLARNFAENNNIQLEKVITALADLFSKQKNTAIKSKQQKLQRRVFSSHSKPKYYHQGNVYTKSSYYQQHPTAPPSPPPFARKAYY